MRRFAVALFVVLVACDKRSTDGAGPDPVVSVAVPTAAPQPSTLPAWIAPLPSASVIPPLMGDGGAGDIVPIDADAGILQVGGSDPLAGKFTLAEALRDLPGAGTLVAKLDTTKGPIDCRLFEDKAPNTVANFVGLARGLRPWRDAKNQWVRRPAYDGTKFHRIVTGFMIQGGDPKGTGSGEPGYTIPDEIWPGATHDRAGQLCMANRGKNTNGAQFFITDGRATHLDGGYTIFGECTPTSRVHEIASDPVDGDRALSPTIIRKITIIRAKAL